MPISLLLLTSSLMIASPELPFNQRSLLLKNGIGFHFMAQTQIVRQTAYFSKEIDLATLFAVISEFHDKQLKGHKRLEKLIANNQNLIHPASSWVRPPLFKVAPTAVLEQDSHVVAYGSRQFSKDEVRLLSSPAKELMSILYGVTLWSSLIAGSKIIVKTDCICWSYLAMASSSSNRMSRLGMLLSEYNIHVEHIPGVKNKASDGLSRALDATTNKQQLEHKSSPCRQTRGPGE
jgi:hypothetical protein